MQRRLLLDVVVGERAAILQLLAGEDEALLVGRDACLFAQSQVALSVVVTNRFDRKSPLVTQTNSRKLDRSVRPGAPAGNMRKLVHCQSFSSHVLTLLVLDFGLHVVDGVGRLHLQRDGLAGQRFNEDLWQRAQ